MLLLWFAFWIDTLVGDPYWIPHPIRYIGRLIEKTEKMLRRDNDSKRKLILKGSLLVLIVCFCSYIVPFFLLLMAFKINYWLFVVINVIFMWLIIAPRCLRDEAVKIQEVLQEGDIEKARKAVSYIVGRDTNQLEEDEIARATIETVMENTSDGVIAPIFYIVIGGVPLGMLYKGINTMDSMIGYKNDRYLYFGQVAAKLDDVVNYIPARITGFLIILAAFFLRFEGKNSFKIMIRDRKKHKSPNAGYPEAAAAGALGIQLGGTNTYFGKKVEKPALGDFQRPIEKEDIHRSVKLLYGATVLMLIILTVVGGFNFEFPWW